MPGDTDLYLNAYLDKTHLQSNNTLLNDKSLYFVWLFYTLSTWDKQKNGRTDTPYLKIPRKDHILHPDKGTPLREASVQTFNDERQRLLAEYSSSLTTEQIELLSSNEHAPKFSTRLMEIQGQMTLMIHYRGGKKMHREQVLTSGTEMEQMYVESISITNRGIAESKKMIDDTKIIIEEKKAKGVNFFRHPVRWLYVSMLKSRIEGDEEYMQTLETLSGGSLGSGGFGVAKLAQQVPIHLPRFPQGKLDQYSDKVPENMLFVAQVPFIPPTDATRTQIPAISGPVMFNAETMFAFRKVSHHPEYDYLKNKKKRDLTEQQRAFQEEVALSNNASGRIHVYLEDPSSTKPQIYSALLEGQDLRDVINDYSVGFKERLIIFFHTLEAVKWVHEHGYIHLDLKPDNIRVIRNDISLLMDFGLAAQCPVGTVIKGKAVGTPGYVAPEVLQGDLSAAADVYSMGKVARSLFYPDRFRSDINTFTVAEADAYKKILDLSKEMISKDPIVRIPLDDAIRICSDAFTQLGMDPTNLEPHAQHLQAARVRH